MPTDLPGTTVQGTDLPVTDLLGTELSDAEAAVLRVYLDLRDLVRRTDLAPCAAANLRAALACAANAVNDLALEYEHLLDDGV
ncbi:MAG TPA: hypothetical protein VIR27_17925 [Mycobacteriales bacterium]|jgi:hypothetical protein